MSEICFKIEEKYLYTDEELVEFNIPIFFICQDEVERINTLQEDELPVEGAYFELSNSKIEKYIERLNEEYSLIQFSIICEKICLQYLLPQQVEEVHIEDSYFINPIRYTTENKEVGYTMWHCKNNRKSNFR